MRMQIVVAHYNEDMTWLRPWQSSLKIYTKGGKLHKVQRAFPNVQVETLPNVGRESHTYLTYIVRHYDDLPERVVFTQAKIGDHMNLGHFRACVESKDDVCGARINHYFKGSFKLAKWRGAQNDDSGMTLGDFFDRYVGGPRPGFMRHPWSMAAIFSASREAILSKPRLYYEELLSLVQTPNPEVGHFLERMWLCIMKANTSAQGDAQRKVPGLYVPGAYLAEMARLILDLRTKPLQYLFGAECGWRPKPGLWLEFGVYKGATINYIAEHASPQQRIYGFDSFYGIPKEWRPGFPAGAFNTDGALPRVRDNVTLVKGNFDDTVQPFLEGRSGECITFIHVDCDLFSSTKTVLDACFPHMSKKDGCVIVFDELVNYDGFSGKNGELRAWYQFCQKYKDRMKYRWIGMNGQMGVRRGKGASESVAVKVWPTNPQTTL